MIPPGAGFRALGRAANELIQATHFDCLEASQLYVIDIYIDLSVQHIRRYAGQLTSTDQPSMLTSHARFTA